VSGESLKRSRAGSSAAAALLALCLGLSACGGSSGSTSTASPTAGADNQNSTSVQGSGGGGEGPAEPKGSKEKGVPASQRGGGPPSSYEAPIPPALKKKAGKAAPFLVPTGDNSIPTYGSEASSSQRDEAAVAKGGLGRCLRRHGQCGAQTA
jgi:hypothetical protein